jgi:histidyl-tRNA synthetase
MNERKAIKPVTLAGFQDYLPERMIIRKVYESFGFLPLDTPSMEKMEVLTGGDQFNKSIFTSRIKTGIEDKGETLEEEDFASRFDLTVSLARVVAAYPEIPKPFKRYQVGKVWRGEKPQKGRFREFLQFDIDTIGSRSVWSDTEIVLVMYRTLKTLGFDRFNIKINDRRILNAIAELLGYQSSDKDLFRTIDKIDRLGIDGVINELISLNKYQGIGKPLGEAEIDLLRKFLSIREDNPEMVLSKVSDLIKGKSDSGDKGLATMQDIITNLGLLGIPREFWSFDLSVARGLDYYTGPVFESYISDVVGLGSVFSGGRFDGLTNRFVPGSNIAGVGASVGVDRVIIAMESKGLVTKTTATADALVTVFNEELSGYAMSLGEKMRASGIKTEVYIGEPVSLKAQIVYAVKRGIRFVVIAGPDEVSQNKLAVKDVLNKSQVSLTTEEAIASILSRLK